MSLESIPEELFKISKAISKSGGSSILVGGAVRDFCLKSKTPEDLDVEVFGINQSVMESVLKNFGQLCSVGKTFGVFKLKTEKAEYDFSLPRFENKIGVGHSGFKTRTDPSMSYEKAASRRDFSVNSIGYDIIKKQFLDPFNGMKDLKKKILRHVGPSFSEDPLRVLRAIQFSARLEFDIDQNTIKLCNNLNLKELSKERIFDEFRKLLIKAKKPSIGFEYAKKLGVLSYFPELKALIGVPQDPEWHPEGDVWTHTLLVVNEAANLREGNEKNDIILMLAALCHDFGKPLTTKFLKGKWRSPSHDSAGVLPTEYFLRRLTNNRYLIEKVKKLVKEHLRPIQLYNDRKLINSGTIRRLSQRVNISELVLLAKADFLGRNLNNINRSCFEAGNWLLSEAKKMEIVNGPPIPLLLGRHLINIGMSPSPKIGLILKKAYEKQLNGDFENLEDAISWAKSNFQKL